MKRSLPSLDGFGLADAYGVIAFIFGALCLGMTLLCCAGARMQRDPMFLAYVVLFCGALWSGGFGVVLRGTPIGRALAWVGLFLTLFASLAAMTWLMVRDVLF